MDGTLSIIYAKGKEKPIDGYSDRLFGLSPMAESKHSKRNLSEQWSFFDLESLFKSFFSFENLMQYSLVHSICRSAKLHSMMWANICVFDELLEQQKQPRG